MMQVTAYLQRHRLSKVIHALHELPRFPGFTVFDGHGQGHGHGAGGHYASDDDRLLYESRSVLVVICEDSEAETIARLIARSARTGNKTGDGIVSISPVFSVLNIHEIAPPAGGGA